MKTVASIEIAAPPEKVWSCLTEREKILQWAPGFERFDYVGEQWSGVGAMHYMVLKMDNRIVRRLAEWTEWVEKERLTCRQILGDLKKYDVTERIKTTTSGSKVTFTIDWVLPYWIIGMVMALFMRGEGEEGNGGGAGKFEEASRRLKTIY